MNLSRMSRYSLSDEAAGLGVDTEKHAANIAKGTEGVHGMKSCSARMSTSDAWCTPSRQVLTIRSDRTCQLK